MNDTAETSRPKPWRKRAARKARNFLVGAIGPPIVRAWARSLRIRWIGDDIRIENGLPATRTNGIYVFWHQRMLVLAGFFRDCGFKVLISQHGDGEMIARVITRLGMQPIRGSTTRGGARAILELIREAKERVNIAITPDGPRGPRHVFQDGAIYIASRTGLPIYPVAVSFKSYVKLPTWDGFILPSPFTRALVRIGTPFTLPQDLDREGLENERARIEAALRELTESTDAGFTDLYAGALDLRDRL